MCTRQKITVFFLAMFLMILCYSCAKSTRIPAVNAREDVSGKTFYTTANIWYEHLDRIYSTNYHRGPIIPVGTKVTIRRVDRDEIKFVDEEGIGYTIVYIQKHSAPNTTVWNYFERYFSKKNPMREGGPFEKFSKSEKDNIKMGNIALGMSKAVVVMSYGYPPGHRTPSIEDNVWIYWTSRFVNKRVYFRDDKVVRIGR